MDHVWDVCYTVGLTSSPSLASIPIFPKDCQRDLYEYYDVDPEIIGEGSFASIRRVKPKAKTKPLQQDHRCGGDAASFIVGGTTTSRSYACKTILKSRLHDRELLRREVYNLNRCQPSSSNNHQNNHNHFVVRFLDILEDRYAVHIVTEFCEGGELLEYVSKEHERTGMGLRGKALSPSCTFVRSMYERDEGRCATIVHQILTAMVCLHENAGVCHRDAKASNFVFVRRPSYVAGSLELRMIDFGLSKFVGSPQEERDYRNSFLRNERPRGPSNTSTTPSNNNGYRGVASMWEVAKTVYRFGGLETLDTQRSDGFTTTTTTTIVDEESRSNKSSVKDAMDETKKDNFLEKELYAKDYPYMTSEVGTPYYVAPEVLTQQQRQQQECQEEESSSTTTTTDGYTTKCDVWSVGVLAFLTLTGSLPVMGTDEQETVQKLMDPNLEIDFSDETLWEQQEDEEGDNDKTDQQTKKPRISSRARRFCQALLQTDPEKRPTAREALDLDWITMHCAGASLLPPGSPPSQRTKTRRLPSLSISTAVVK